LSEQIKKSANNSPVTLELKNDFRKILKQGIYKELHVRQLLSGEQLDLLLKKNQ